MKELQNYDFWKLKSDSQLYKNVSGINGIYYG